MPQAPIRSPLGERDLADQPGLDPVRLGRLRRGARERTLAGRQAIQPVAEAPRPRRREPGADFPDVPEPGARFWHSQQKCPDADATALRVGEASDHDLLASLALHLD